jgi:ABC-type nitrate/sulfonate/bicarbonate transport system substrate-binding protein
MIKPLVDKGIFRRIADCPTPWPCFVIAVRDEVLENNPEVIKDILSCINETTKKFKDIPDIDKTLAKHYNQKNRRYSKNGYH